MGARTGDADFEELDLWAASGGLREEVRDRWAHEGILGLLPSQLLRVMRWAALHSGAAPPQALGDCPEAIIEATTRQAFDSIPWRGFGMLPVEILQRVGPNVGIVEASAILSCVCPEFYGVFSPALLVAAGMERVGLVQEAYPELGTRLTYKAAHLEMHVAKLERALWACDILGG